MAKQLKLSAQTRTGIGRTAVKQIKKQGLVPAVVYGGSETPVAITLNAREIRTILSHATSEHFLVDLDIAGTGSRLALVQEVQHDPIRGDVLHVDFHAVKADEALHAEIPVETEGEPTGVRNFGGILEISIHALEIECLPKDLPEIIRIDVSGLNVGDAIHVKDLQLPDGVTTRVDAELTVVRVSAPNVEIEPAAGSAEPEVLKEKKDDKAAAKPAAAKPDAAKK
jgi:large subunit ribosomal protein L25